MLRAALLLCAIAASAGGVSLAQADVHIKPADLNGTRALQASTANAAIRNYIQAWEGFRSAFEQNRVDLLDRDFIGTAREKLAQTIQQQAQLGIHTSYQDRVHDIQIVFYSPEGLSLELIDDVQYDMQLMDHDKAAVTQHVKVRYVVVLSPTETKWRVRVFQAVPE
ncbi:MAG TPA: hypothetical protein VHZ28_01420 [Terracidiphilus sp.]|nr:hypothetical protein [Terracidiphilus sp.]